MHAWTISSGQLWSEMSKMLGVVVVGFGRIGKVRVRDVQQKLFGDDVVIRAVVSRRQVETEVPVLPLDEAINRADVDAVIVTTENCTHEQFVRTALEAGKHVLVEFPLACSAQAGKDLLKLAEEKGLICHVEHIEHLAPTLGLLHEAIKTKPPLKEGTLHFKAPPGSSWWTSDIQLSGFPSFRGISNLHNLYALFGELSVESAHFETSENRTVLTSKLVTASQRPLTYIEERGGDTRSMNMTFTFEDGSVLTNEAVKPPPPGGSGSVGPARRGMFAQDMDIFLAEVRGERPKEVIEAEKRRIVHCLELADKIEKIATK